MLLKYNPATEGVVRKRDIKEVEFIKFSDCLYMEYEERITPHLWVVAPFSKINKQGEEYV